METMFQLLYTKWMYPQLDTAICKQTIEKTKENYRVKQKSPTEFFPGRTNVAFERTKLHKYNTF